jgi:hypothetical protein
MKRALLVGIDTYDHLGTLEGCVKDVKALMPLLSRHDDASPNFKCRACTSSDSRVDRRTLLDAIEALLSPGADVALLYFAGHGHNAPNDVALATQEAVNRDEGVTLSTVLGKVQHSPIHEVVIILDCCFSGGAGGVPQLGINAAALRQGVAILSASQADQTAVETSSGRGLFSTYLCGALEGGAADVLGKVTLAGLYAYLSESFGPWDQRPTFKANLNRLHDLRRCTPWVPVTELRRLPEFFPVEEHVFPLDPSYEPEAEPKDPEHEAIFAFLQRCRSAKLIEPVGAEHMYFAAMKSTGCRLTRLGQLYWRMAKQDLL